jgi:hypothetical protein
MHLWLLITLMTQPHSSGIDVQQFNDKATCEAAGAVVKQTLLELDPHSIRGGVEWRCVPITPAEASQGKDKGS